MKITRSKKSFNLKKAGYQIARILLFFSAGLGILYLVYHNLDASYQEDCALKGIPSAECSLLHKVWTDFLAVDMKWLLLVLILFMVSNVWRTLRWQMLLRPMGYYPGFWASFFSIMLGYFANLGLPRMGEVFRGVALAKHEDIPFEKVMGTIVTDRIMDFLMLGIFLALGFWVKFDTFWGFLTSALGEKHFSIFHLGGTLIALIALIGLISLTRKTWRTWSFVRIIRGKLIGFWQGIQSVKSVSSPLLFILYTIGIWMMYYLMLYFCFKCYTPTASLDLKAALVTFDYGTLGMVAPFPGGMGSYHFMIIKALEQYGINKVDGFSFANINFFSIQIFCNILFGLMALILLPIMKRRQPMTEGLTDQESSVD